MALLSSGGKMTSEVAYKTRRLVPTNLRNKTCKICGKSCDTYNSLTSQVSFKTICKDCLVDTLFNALDIIEKKKK